MVFYLEVISGQGFGVELFIMFFVVLIYFVMYDKKCKDLSGFFFFILGLVIVVSYLFVVS